MADLQQQLQSILSDPETMDQISALAGALTGTPAEPAPEASPSTDQPPDLSALLSALGGDGGADPALLHTAAALLEAYNAPDDDKTALLDALRPFLSPQRQEKLDRAAQTARMSRVLRAVVHLWKGDGTDV